jgi:hypothetical protein
MNLAEWMGKTKIGSWLKEYLWLKMGCMHRIFWAVAGVILFLVAREIWRMVFP